MRNDLSPSLVHHLGGSFFRPSYLVEIFHNYPELGSLYWRWCTNDGPITWNGQTWNLRGFNINGLTWDTKIKNNISINIQNLDQAIASDILNYNLADKQVNIWLLYLYTRNIFISSTTNLEGSHKITVEEPIPGDIASTGTIYIGSSINETDIVSYTYSSWKGRVFNITTPLTKTIPYPQQCYILKSSGYSLKDAVQVFSGAIDDIELDEKVCTINLIPQSSKTQYTPRRFVNKNNGFNWLPQAGLKIHWNNQVFTLERAKY